MSPDKDDRAYVWDMLMAAKAVSEFVRGRALDGYLADLLLRSESNVRSKSSEKRQGVYLMSFNSRMRKFSGTRFKHNDTFWLTITGRSSTTEFGVWPPFIFPN